MSRDYFDMKDVQFADLLGKTLTEVRNDGNAELVFTTSEGEIYKLYHGQDCCESVCIEDICGELNDLVGSPITQAEENSSSDQQADRPCSDSFLWTFYRIATAKGQVVVRWLGESNGWYSESVQFGRLKTQNRKTKNETH